MQIVQLFRGKMQFFLGTISATIALTNVAQAQLYITPGEIEVLQAEATLQYHSGNLDEALNILKKIIESSRPGSSASVAALEMEALAFRQTKNDALAAGIYKKLIQTAPNEKKAPYYFELGTIRFQQKNLVEAKECFTKSAEAEFNAGTSRFFLGLIESEQQNHRRALYRFSYAVSAPDSSPLLPATRLYLANSYLQLGKTESAIRNLIESVKLADYAAKNKKKSAISEGAGKGAEKTLKSLDSSKLFASISLLQQLDTNVQSFPTSVKSSVPATNRQSFKSVLSASVAYSTSPVKTWQFTPLYAFYTNYNYNGNTRDFDFLSHTAGVYIFHKPYLRLSKGFKAQSVFSMKNTAPNTKTGTLYSKFSLTHEVGPMIKYELTPRVFYNAELSWKPKTFYTDPPQGENRRSGQGVYMKHAIDFISIYDLWNPQAYFTFEWDLPVGANFKSTSFGAGVSNKMQVTKKLSITEFFDSTFSNFYNNKPNRSDKFFNARVLFANTMNAHWSWLFDVSYMTNKSSIPTSYEYDRWTSSLGATYSF